MKKQEDLLNTMDNKEFSKELEFTNLENSPFTIVKQGNEYFGVIGNHRITEAYNDYLTCETELLEITWNRLIQVIWAVVDKFKLTDEIKNKLENE